GDPRLAVAVAVGCLARPPDLQDRHRGHGDEREPGRDDQPERGGLDVVEVVAGDRQAEQAAAEEEQDHRLRVAPHSSTAPAATAAASAATSAAGANRTAKERPKVAACMAASLTSTNGPTTMNASFAVGENWVSEAATNASASEHIDTRTASRASASTPRTGCSAIRASQASGISVFRVAAIAAPRTR